MAHKKSQIIVLSFFHCIKIKICIVRLFLHCRSSKQRKLIVAQQHHFVAPRKTENVITSLLITILIVYFLFTIPVIVHDLASQFIGKFFFCFFLQRVRVSWPIKTWHKTQADPGRVGPPSDLKAQVFHLKARLKFWISQMRMGSQPQKVQATVFITSFHAHKCEVHFSWWDMKFFHDFYRPQTKFGGKVIFS